MGSLGDRVGHHGEKSDQRQHERQRGKQSSQNHREALTSDGLRHDGGHRPNAARWLIRIELVNGGPRDRSVAPWFIARVEDNHHLQ